MHSYLYLISIALLCDIYNKVIVVVVVGLKRSMRYVKTIKIYRENDSDENAYYIDAGMKDGDSQVDRSEKENWRAKRA